jgi:hypothetical protein
MFPGNAIAATLDEVEVPKVVAVRTKRWLRLRDSPWRWRKLSAGKRPATASL